MWTEERIIAECKRISIVVNDNFDIPVIINSRIVRTLGRVYMDWVGGKYVPTKMEISKTLLETGTDNDILSVIQHEWVHYYVTKDTGEDHGHDRLFKAVCARIGCDNDCAKANLESASERKAAYKYTLYCNTCKENISGYTRMCPTLRNLSACRCKKCGTYNLSYFQNW